MAKKVTWKEKLESTAKKHGLPKVVKIDKRLAARWGEGTCVIADPKEVDELMRSVPKGKVTTINHIRDELARRHKTDMACPITTGIFARIAAGAAEEDAATGKREITPYWRTLKAGGVVNEKYPGGEKEQKHLLEKEGLRVEKRGKKFVVAEFENNLAGL